MLGREDAFFSVGTSMLGLRTDLIIYLSRGEMRPSAFPRRQPLYYATKSTISLSDPIGLVVVPVVLFLPFPSLLESSFPGKSRWPFRLAPATPKNFPDSSVERWERRGGGRILARNFDTNQIMSRRCSLKHALKWITFALIYRMFFWVRFDPSYFLSQG